MRQLLQTITETINTLFPVINFLKCVVTEVVLFSIVAFKTLAFHKSHHIWGVVGYLVTVLLQTFSSLWQWSKFESAWAYLEGGAGAAPPIEEIFALLNIA